MKLEIALLVLTLFAAVGFAEKKNGLRIGVKKRPETCDMRSKNGDKLSMHYTVSVAGISQLFSNPQPLLNTAGDTGGWNRI